MASARRERQRANRAAGTVAVIEPEPDPDPIAGRWAYRLLRLWAWIVCPTCWGRGKHRWADRTVERFG